MMLLWDLFCHFIEPPPVVSSFLFPVSTGIQRKQKVMDKSRDSSINFHEAAKEERCISIKLSLSQASIPAFLDLTFNPFPWATLATFFLTVVRPIKQTK
jgi:hypothetical protein